MPEIHESHVTRRKTGDYLVCIACMICLCHSPEDMKKE